MVRSAPPVATRLPSSENATAFALCAGVDNGRACPAAFHKAAEPSAQPARTCSPSGETAMLLTADEETCKLRKPRPVRTSQNLILPSTPEEIASRESGENTTHVI